MRHTTEHERKFLGGLILYPELIYQFDDLKRHHFSTDFSHIVYEAIKKVDLDDLKNDGVYVALIDQLKSGMFQEGEYALVSACFDENAATTNPYVVERSYGALKAVYEQRVFLSDLEKIVNNSDTFSSQIDAIEEILELQKKGASGIDKAYKLSDVKSTINKNIVDVKFGISKLDSIIKVEANSLVIIAARPFSGKTTFACFMAFENVYANKRVLFYSMEMTKEQIAWRMRRFGMDYDRDKFMIVDKPKSRINDIVRTAYKYKPDMIVIDQLNKLVGDGKTEYEKITNVIRSLKVKAGEMRIPIVCLAQINRDAAEGRPHIHNLKSSGSIEEESDVIILLHVSDRENKLTTAYLDKNRTLNGRLGYVEMFFNEEVNNYYER